MIITVDPDRRFHDRVLRAVAGTTWAHQSAHIDDPGHAPDVVTTGGVPTVVVVGPRVAVPAATSLAQRITAGTVPAAVILVSDPTNEVLRSAMRAGARDVLAPSFSDDELRSAIARTGLADVAEVTGPGLTVAVFSTKGGVGTSTIAANLAARLGDRLDADAILLDLDVASADQSIMHGLTPSWTLQELVDGTIGMDAESLKQVLRPIEDSSASVLPGPLDPALAETIAGDAVARVIGASRAVAPLVVLDTASSFDDRTLAAIDAADAVVIVSSLDVAALRALTVALQTFDRIGADPARIRVALVRADSKSGLQVGDVERAIGRQVDARIPSSRAVVRALNEGVPLAVSAPRSSYVQAIDELVESVLDFGGDELRQAAEESTSGSRSWFGFGRSRASDDGDDGKDRSDGRPASSGTTATAATGGVVPRTPPPSGDGPSSASSDGPPTGQPPAAERTGAPRSLQERVEGTGRTTGASGTATALAVQDHESDGDVENTAVGARTDQHDHDASGTDASTEARTDDGLALDALPPPGANDEAEEDDRRRRFGRRR